jgi:enoyl-CoA hydratase/carnithine racemase
MTEPTAAPSTPILSVSDGRARVTLNRPGQHNRIEPADLAALIEIFDRVDRDGDIRALVITGTGKSFSSGFHIGALADRKDKPASTSDPDAFEKMVDRLEALRVPTIAALNGGVYGGATDLALACDFRIGVPGMRMFMPAARLGIVYYPSGLERYVNRLGLAAAKRMFLTAEPIEADALLRCGYLDEIVPPDDLMGRVEALASTIAANAPLAVAATKRALNQVAAGRLDREELRNARRRCAASEDHKEGLKAWAEKRKPRFRGA